MKTVMEQVKTRSVEPHTRFALPEENWDELNQPGAYALEARLRCAQRNIDPNF